MEVVFVVSAGVFAALSQTPNPAFGNQSRKKNEYETFELLACIVHANVDPALKLFFKTFLFLQWP